MSHTPGPWKIDNHPVMDDDGIPVICIWGPDGEGFGRVGMAYAECGYEDDLLDNALAQAAAPELLEACELAEKILSEQIEIVCGAGWSKNITEKDREDIYKLRSAIAKAKGE